VRNVGCNSINKGTNVNEIQIVKKLEKIFYEVFPELEGKNIELNKLYSDFENWDSFNHMEIVLKVEEVFDINIDIDESIELDYPRKFIDLIKTKLGE